MLASHLNSAFPDLHPSLLLGMIFSVVLLRYLVFAGGALLILMAFRSQISHHRLQAQPISMRQLAHEAGFSMLSFIIFGLVGFAVHRANEELGFIQLYRSIDGTLGWLWFALSIPLALLVHDFYFYWMHRFIHLPGVYGLVHSVHHKSTNPTPLAAFSFHPLEAVLEVLGFVVMMSVVPMHPVAFLIVSTVMIVMNVTGHLGYELFPASWQHHPVMKFANTSTSHNQHHRTYRYNYGLYTLIWDRLFGTLHPKYERTFKAASRPKSARSKPSIPLKHPEI